MICFCYTFFDRAKETNRFEKNRGENVRGYWLVLIFLVLFSKKLRFFFYEYDIHNKKIKNNKKNKLDAT